MLRKKIPKLGSWVLLRIPRQFNDTFEVTELRFGRDDCFISASIGHSGHERIQNNEQRDNSR